MGSKVVPCSVQKLPRNSFKGLVVPDALSEVLGASVGAGSGAGASAADTYGVGAGGTLEGGATLEGDPGAAGSGAEDEESFREESIVAELCGDKVLYACIPASE